MAANASDDMPSLRCLGLDSVGEAVYLALLRDPDLDVDGLATVVGLDRTTVVEALDLLSDADLCRRDGQSLRIPSPQQAIDGLINRREDELRAVLEQLEESRRTVGSLLETYVDQHLQGVADGLDRLEGQEAIGALLRRLADRARADVVNVSTSVPSVEAARAAVETDNLAMRKGVTLRTIVPASVRGEADAWSFLVERVEAGLQVRLHPAPPTRCILVDGATAVLPVDPTDVSRGVWVIRTPGLLQPVRLLVEQLWAQSAAAEANREDGEEVRVREVFRLLSQGQKDESIARRLGTSVRTVRRLVAVGMQSLGTESRFEAGVMAERRGWLAG